MNGRGDWRGFMHRNPNNRCSAYKFRRFSSPEKFTEIETLLHSEMVSLFSKLPAIPIFSESLTWNWPGCLWIHRVLCLCPACGRLYFHLLLWLFTYTWFVNASPWRWLCDHSLVPHGTQCDGLRTVACSVIFVEWMGNRNNILHRLYSFLFNCIQSLQT